MGVLTPLTGVNKSWHWGATEQHMFEGIESIVKVWSKQHRVALSYSAGMPKINLVTDACLTGGSGYLSQGDDVSRAKVCAF